MMPFLSQYAVCASMKRELRDASSRYLKCCVKVMSIIKSVPWIPEPQLIFKKLHPLCRIRRFLAIYYKIRFEIILEPRVKPNEGTFSSRWSSNLKGWAVKNRAVIKLKLCNDFVLRIRFFHSLNAFDNSLVHSGWKSCKSLTCIIH